MLGAYTPRGLYHALQNAGYETKPFKREKFTEIFHLKRVEDTG